MIDLHFEAAQKGFQRGRKEARGATNKWRHVCARRRDGEPAVSGSEAVLFSPARPELPEQLFPVRYVEGCARLRSKREGCFSSLWRSR